MSGPKVSSAKTQQCRGNQMLERTRSHFGETRSIHGVKRANSSASTAATAFKRLLSQTMQGHAGHTHPVLEHTGFERPHNEVIIQIDWRKSDSLPQSCHNHSNTRKQLDLSQMISSTGTVSTWKTSNSMANALRLFQNCNHTRTKTQTNKPD